MCFLHIKSMVCSYQHCRQVSFVELFVQLTRVTTTTGNMATTGSRQDISMPLLQIRYIKCTEKIPGLMVAIAGLLTSLWANCILIVICLQDDYYNYQQPEKYIPSTIIHTSQLTHLTIVITCTAGLVLGLKEKNRTYLSPWLIIKLIELIALFVGCIMLATGGRQTYIGLMPLGICFLLIGGYITLCVWDTYSKMNVVTRTTSLENVSLNGPDDLTLPKDPPSYESFINVNRT